MTKSSQDATRTKLLSAARQQFAARGFHGASIAQIAGELDLTKQALLYHFKRKEDLYAEVLRSIAERMMAAMRTSGASEDSPAAHFEGMMLGIYETAQDNPLDTKILMRELLENQRQETPSEEWYFKAFLDEIVSRLDAVDGNAQKPFSQKLASVYLLVSSIEYFAASGAVLRRFYGDAEYEQIAASYRAELTAQVRRLTGSDAA